MTTCMDLYLPRWYVLVAGKIDDAYSKEQDQLSELERPAWLEE